MEDPPKVTLDLGWSWENDPDPLRARQKLARNLQRQIRSAHRELPRFVRALIDTGHVIESGLNDPPYVWLLDDLQITGLFVYLRDEKTEGWTLPRLCSLFLNSRREPMNHASVKAMLSKAGGVPSLLPEVAAEALENAGYCQHRTLKKKTG